MGGRNRTPWGGCIIGGGAIIWGGSIFLRGSSGCSCSTPGTRKDVVPVPSEPGHFMDPAVVLCVSRVTALYENLSPVLRTSASRAPFPEIRRSPGRWERATLPVNKGLAPRPLLREDKTRVAKAKPRPWFQSAAGRPARDQRAPLSPCQNDTR